MKTYMRDGPRVSAQNSRTLLGSSVRHLAVAYEPSVVHRCPCGRRVPPSLWTGRPKRCCSDRCTQRYYDRRRRGLPFEADIQKGSGTRRWAAQRLRARLAQDIERRLNSYQSAMAAHTL